MEEDIQLDERNASARYRSEVKIAKAELCFTKDLGKWQDRNWESLPAKIQDDKVSAEIPADATVWYFNLFDDRDCVVSTEHMERVPAADRYPSGYALLPCVPCIPWFYGLRVLYRSMTLARVVKTNCGASKPHRMQP